MIQIVDQIGCHSMQILDSGIIRHTNQTPIPVYQIPLDIDNNKLIEDIKEHRKNFPEGEVSNVKAWRSSYRTHHETDKFNPYISKILQAVDNCRQYDTEFHSRLPLATYKVHDFWALMYEQGDYTVKHTHFPCTWASCYYAYADEDSAPIRFSMLRIKPKSGMLLLWPALLFHSVPETKGKRIAISANLIIKDFGT